MVAYQPQNRIWPVLTARHWRVARAFFAAFGGRNRDFRLGQLQTGFGVFLRLGDLLARKGRLADAVAAWTRALSGDGQDIDKGAIEKKIGSARSKLQNAK